MTQLLTAQPFTLKVILILISGIVLIRLSGKRSIAQVTVPEIVLMIAVGTILVQTASTENQWTAIYGGFILVTGMLFVNKLQVKFPWLRKWINGIPSILIQDGKVEVKELKKLRMNMDQLEMMLRKLQVYNVNDVKTAVLETSGDLSVLLKEEYKPAEKADIQKVLEQLELIHHELAVLRKLKLIPSHPETEVPDVTETTPSSLFTEALLEDRIDNNITKQ